MQKISWIKTFTEIRIKQPIKHLFEDFFFFLTSLKQKQKAFVAIQMRFFGYKARNWPHLQIAHRLFVKVNTCYNLDAIFNPCNPRLSGGDCS